MFVTSFLRTRTPNTQANTPSPSANDVRPLEAVLFAFLLLPPLPPPRALDLVFAIDCTGSMDPFLDAELARILERMTQPPQKTRFSNLVSTVCGSRVRSSSPTKMPLVRGTVASLLGREGQHTHMDPTRFPSKRTHLADVRAALAYLDDASCLLVRVDEADHALLLARRESEMRDEAAREAATRRAARLGLLVDDLRARCAGVPDATSSLADATLDAEWTAFVTSSSGRTASEGTHKRLATAREALQRACEEAEAIEHDTGSSSYSDYSESSTCSSEEEEEEDEEEDSDESSMEESEEEEDERGRRRGGEARKRPRGGPGKE